MANDKFSFVLSPGTLALASTLTKLFGPEFVNIGTWPGPCYVYEVTEEDVKAAVAIVNEKAMQPVIYRKA